MLRLGFLSGSVIKNLPANIGTAGDLGSIPGLVQYPGRDWNGNPLQYSCLENPMGRGGFRATVHRVAKSQTWLSDWPRVQAHLRYVGCCLLSWWMSWSPEWNSALWLNCMTEQAAAPSLYSSSFEVVPCQWDKWKIQHGNFKITLPLGGLRRFLTQRCKL